MGSITLQRREQYDYHNPEASRWRAPVDTMNRPLVPYDARNSFTKSGPSEVILLHGDGQHYTKT
jgi:hypothetical protein